MTVVAPVPAWAPAEWLAQIDARLLTIAAGSGTKLDEQAVLTLQAGGKRLRPTLVYLVAGATQADAAKLERCAVAVELLHCATLIHDDILDHAALRRSAPTVLARCGHEVAVATGNLLFAHAFSELAHNNCAQSLEILSRACAALADGELAQRADAYDSSTTYERYFHRCEQKTAALFEASCELGALLGDLSVARLGAFGRKIGTAFQMLDDLIDVCGSTEVIGKQRGADLLDGTVTLPLILARESDPGLAELDLTTIESPTQAEQICDRIMQTGVQTIVQSEALSLVSEAKELLDGLTHEHRQSLEALSDAVVDRFS